jgi:hypothetical protein
MDKKKMLGAAEMQQWHKGQRPTAAAMTAKQGKCQQSPQTVHRAEGHQAGSCFFHQDSKNKCQDTAGEPATALVEKKKYRTQLKGQICRNTSHFQKFCPHQREKEEMAVRLRLLRTNSLKEGAMWHIY